MRVYAYNEEGLYTGSRELREDVLNGGFLPLAGNETTDVPPAILARQIARYLNGTWSVIPDNRGVTYYNISTREPHTIMEAGIEPEDSWTEAVPPAEPWKSFDNASNDWTVDFDLLKAYVKEQISSACDDEMKTKNIGLQSSAIGAKIDCREIDVLRLDQLIAIKESQGATVSEVINYICYDNSLKAVTLADVRAAKIEISETIMNMLYHKHALYALIDALSPATASPEDYLAIRWSWPVT